MTDTSTCEIKTKLQVTCRNCSLSDLCIPRGLSQEDINRIAHIVGRRKTLHKGDYLYRKGDKFRGIMAIKAGTAKLLTSDLHGNEFLTGYLLPGELLGFDALADDQHSFSAVALETLNYCELPADQLDNLCREVPNLLRELFRHVGETLASETDVNVLTRRPADERVAGFLLNLSDRLSRRGFSAIDFKLSLTRQEIGNYLGLALETVSRSLKNFEDSGLITVHNKLIHIADMERLRSQYGRH
ncbi:MAG: helix-turn-helix domain-containing protein [Methylococcaceae bacterium]|nr:helix-turn-helix domain-containing protein [Methylococcaceae bacterium]